MTQKTSKSKNIFYPLTLLCLLIFGIFVASSKIFAQAVDATEALNALPYIQPVMTYLWDIIGQLVKGFSYLIIATFLLQTAVNNSVAWIDINSNFVQAGLSITTAMADVLLTTIFIVIALAYVFKVESFQAQKSLPKFFIVALLIHFAPLFVGMVTDIANIMIKGIMIGNENIFTNTFLIDMATNVALSIGALGASFAAAAVLSLAWVGGTAANVIMIGIVVANLFVGIPVYLTQILVLNITGGILFSYAMLFLTRVFMIQLLAILAPLAILSYAIPQTKKLFDLWKDWLLGWSFGGILVLFLLVLGLTCLDVIGNLPKEDVSAGAGSWIVNMVMGWQFKWMALAVYMMAVEAFCLVAVPALAKQFTEKVESGGRGIKAIGNPIREKIVTKLQEGRPIDQGGRGGIISSPSQKKYKITKDTLIETGGEPAAPASSPEAK